MSTDESIQSSDLDPRTALEVAQRARPDFGEDDYVQLPNFGEGHYSLADAALVGAIDMWVARAIPGIVEYDSWQDEIDLPSTREALRPKQAELAGALLRSVEAGHLAAVVLGRSLPDSRPLLERTFVTIDALIDWLRIHGHEYCDFIQEILDDRAPWQTASRVAKSRAWLRQPLPEPADIDMQFDEPAALIEHLKRELEEASLHNASLAKELVHRRSDGRGRASSSGETKKRQTLLCIVAALCSKLKVDAAARGAAAQIASILQESGMPVDEDTIRTNLAGLQDAIEARTR